MGVSNGAVLSIVAAGHDKTKLIDGVIAESPYLSPKEVFFFLSFFPFPSFFFLFFFY